MSKTDNSACHDACKCRTTFVCVPPTQAREVYLAGSFNGWDPHALRMTGHNGRFSRRVDLSEGQHQYKFVVDGEWINDPAAAAQVPNDMGTLNSVVIV